MTCQSPCETDYIASLALDLTALGMVGIGATLCLSHQDFHLFSLSHFLRLFFFWFQDGGRKSWAGHAWAAVRAPGLPRHWRSLDAAAGFLPEDEAHQQPPGPFWPREWLRNPLMCSRGCAWMSGLRCMLRCITALCMHGWEWTCSHSHAWFQAAGMFASGVNYHLPEKTPGCSE